MILLNVSTEDTFLAIDENGEEIDLESDTFLFEIESFRHSSHNYFEDVIERENEQRYEVSCEGLFFTDQNGLTVQDGAMYGIDEQGDLYDLEPLCSFRPSEY